MHCALLEGFKKCVEFSKTDITRYFLEAEGDLLNYGKYAARLPMAVEKVRCSEQPWLTIDIMDIAGKATSN